MHFLAKLRENSNNSQEKSFQSSKIEDQEMEMFSDELDEIFVNDWHSLNFLCFSSFCVFFYYVSLINSNLKFNQKSINL